MLYKESGVNTVQIWIFVNLSRTSITYYSYFDVSCVKYICNGTDIAYYNYLLILTFLVVMYLIIAYGRGKIFSKT